MGSSINNRTKNVKAARELAATDVRPDVMALIDGLNAACEQDDVRAACMHLAAMDVMRVDGQVSLEEGVLFFRATCFLLDHPHRKVIRKEIEASQKAWQAFVKLRNAAKGPVCESGRVGEFDTTQF